jgi:hypothetical protein
MVWEYGSHAHASFDLNGEALLAIANPGALVGLMIRRCAAASAGVQEEEI